MKIDLIISADDIKKEKVAGKTVVVIDILRATSVIITAINNGCNGVIPVLTIEEALEIASKDRNKFILGGERKALKIEGFDCSNSPLEYTKETVKGKTLVMTTSNGTRAIKGSEGAGNILLGSFINGKAVAEKVIEIGDDVVFVNAGTVGQFSIDDFICSGYIIDCILKGIYNSEDYESALKQNDQRVELFDVAKTAHYIYENNKDVKGFIKYARHYKRIEELNLLDDVDYCISKDIIQVVPAYKDGIIK